MGRKRRLTTDTRLHAEHCLRIVRAALSDKRSPGVIDEHEAPLVLRAVSSTHDFSVVADDAGALSQAIERGVETDTYFEHKIVEFRTALDGLPLSIA
ncbi:MAG: hypothetical protein IT337_13705 [Thermomicrobiales bacterium]|nr:hypothetical protein [Thermomicrobiales bacterium]